MTNTVFGNTTMKIFNLIGEELFTKDKLIGDSFQLNIAGFPSGFYYLQIIENNLMLTKFIVVE